MKKINKKIKIIIYLIKFTELRNRNNFVVMSHFNGMERYLFGNHSMLNNQESSTNIHCQPLWTCVERTGKQLITWNMGETEGRMDHLVRISSNLLVPSKYQLKYR